MIVEAEKLKKGDIVTVVSFDGKTLHTGAHVVDVNIAGFTIREPDGMPLHFDFDDLGAWWLPGEVAADSDAGKALLATSALAAA